MSFLTLLESDFDDDELVKTQIYATIEELQKAIDDFLDQSGLLRAKRKLVDPRIPIDETGQITGRTGFEVVVTIIFNIISAIFSSF